MTLLSRSNSGRRVGVGFLAFRWRDDIVGDEVPLHRVLGVLRTGGERSAFGDNNFRTATHTLINSKLRIQFSVEWHVRTPAFRLS